MTKMHILIPATAAAALLATAAVAQVPGVGGRVGGSVSGNVQIPRTAPITGNVRETIRDGRDVTRDTIRDGRRAAREARPDVEADANASAEAGARADSQGAQAGLDISAGGSVRSSDGANLGSIVDVARDSAGRTTAFLVRSADGAVRSVPADGASIQGDAVVTAWTEGQFRAQRPR